MIRAILLGSAFFAAFSSARADSLCDYYQSHQQDLYKLICQNGSATTRPAGANSTFASAFNLSSASLPTEPSSYGLEVLANQLRTPDGTISPTFSLVKGFKKFGTGISTGSNTTFYGDDLHQRVAGTPYLTTFDAVEPQRGSFPNLNIGTAVELYSFAHGPSVRVGLSARYNKISDTWGGGPAVVLNWSRFSLGAGYTRETISNLLPRLTFTSAQASVRLWLLEVEYNRLSDNSDFGLRPIHIFTSTLTVHHLLLTAAVRRLDYIQFGMVTQWHYAIQYLFTSHLSAGFLFNYIPGANSVGVQYFL